MYERYIYLVEITAIILGVHATKADNSRHHDELCFHLQLRKGSLRRKQCLSCTLSTINLLALLTSLYLLYRKNNLFDRAKRDTVANSSAVIA